MTKVQLITEISKLGYKKTLTTLWTYKKDKLIKILKKLKEETKNG